MVVGLGVRRAIGGALRRRWSSTARLTGNGQAATNGNGPRVAASRTPGVARVRRAGASKDVEVDSTIARIIGSDWGDRRGQTVSLPMRIYWILFAVVLVNGALTYVTGNDESFYMDLLKKKADEKLGVVEEVSEFETVAGGKGSSADSSTTAEGDVVEKPAAPTTKTTTSPSQQASPASTATPPPVSIFNAPRSASPSPFFSPVVGARSAPSVPRELSKDELQAQLNHLRSRQTTLRETASSLTGAHRDEIEHQIRLIDEQKAQLKMSIKQL